MTPENRNRVGLLMVLVGTVIGIVGAVLFIRKLQKRG